MFTKLTFGKATRSGPTYLPVPSQPGEGRGTCFKEPTQ